MVLHTQFQQINKKAYSHLDDAQQLYEYKYYQSYLNQATLALSETSKN